MFSFGLGHFGVLGRSFTPYDHDPGAAVAGLGVVDGEGELPAVNQARLQLPNEAQLNAAENDRNAAEELIAHLDMLANLSVRTVTSTCCHLCDFFLLTSITRFFFQLTDSSDQCIPKVIDSLAGVNIVGASAGHRHTLLLDDRGGLYSCGAGISGCLGHGDNASSSYPLRIKYFGKCRISRWRKLV